jgi:hypothetical protein
MSSPHPFEAALPPAGSVSSGARELLRGHLERGDLQAADAAFSGILASMRPIGAEGRRQWAAALEACAALKERLERPEEARRLRQRAASARKDPSELRRKQGSDQGQRWDEHAWVKAQVEEPDAGRPDRIAAVQRELDRQLRLQERRQRALKLGAGGLAGLVSSPVLGLPIGLGGALGAGLAWAWLRRR